VQRQILGYLAQFPPGKDKIQVLIWPQYAMRIVFVPRILREALVVGLDKARHQGIRGVDSRDALESKLLHQPVLER